MTDMPKEKQPASKTRQWRRVKQVGSYEWISCAGKDNPVQDGKAEVLWPDGSITQENVTIVPSREVYYDHGHAHDGPSTTAYIRQTIRGLTVPLALHEINVRIRCPQDLQKDEYDD